MKKIILKTQVIGHKIFSDSGEIDVETDYLNGKVYLNPPGDGCGVQILREFAAATEKAIDLMDKHCPEELEE